LTALDDPPLLDLVEPPVNPPVQSGFPALVRRALSRVGSVSIESWLTLVIVAGSVLFTLAQLHPSNILSNTTPTGGDMGAHVWGPAYLRDHLLPKWRLSGWAPDWYAGFPMYTFYMVVPALMVVAVDLVLPYGEALKIVSVLGVLSFPVCAWAFGRLVGLRHLYPALLAVAATWFIWDESWQIYGGNIASTMAGEFSFSISLSLALVYLGLLIRGLRTGKSPALTAVVFALCVLCHGIVAIYVVVATIVALAMYFSRPAMKWAVRALPVGGLLAAFWMLPFVLQRRFMSDMGYEPRPIGTAPNGQPDSNWQMLFPQGRGVDRLIVALAIVGVVGSIVLRRRVGVYLAVLFGLFSLWALVWEGPLLWNPRLLPFVYLLRFFLCALGAGDLFLALRGAVVQRNRWPLLQWLMVLSGLSLMAAAVELSNQVSWWWVAVVWIPPVAVGCVILARLIKQAGDPDRIPVGWRLAPAIAAATVVLIFIAMGLRIMPGGSTDLAGSCRTPSGGVSATKPYDWGPFTSCHKTLSAAWAQWNYVGYEGHAAYGEYRDLMLTMTDVGQEHGCGRALWENQDNEGRYGTPMALMLLPYWTDSCIGSMEGLFFESSATTPYHFMTRSSASLANGNPHRDLPPSPFDMTEAVRRMQMLGVKYYMAVSTQAIADARKSPSLTEVASSGPWRVFEVANSELVVPLQNQPVVVSGADSLKDWRNLSAAWLCRPEVDDVYLAEDGPSEWAHTTSESAPSPCPSERSASTPPTRQVAADVPKQPLPPVTVSNIVVDDDSMSFHVDQVGVPVLVRTSYFPNWKASGAKGPWRVSPNLMVVIPTSNDVHLHYGRSPVELASMGLSAVGLALLVWVWRRGDVEFPVTPATTGGLLVEWQDSADDEEREDERDAPH